MEDCGELATLDQFLRKDYKLPIEGVNQQEYIREILDLFAKECCIFLKKLSFECSIKSKTH